MSMNIYSVTLPMMLDARERRQMIQNRLLADFKFPLVCLTMNIAGDIKDTPAIRFAFSYGIKAISHLLGNPVHFEISEGPTGREAFFVYSDDASIIKSKTVGIEEIHCIGRLFDIDVLDINGEKLSRTNTRQCIVCGGPVALCSRSRRHGLDKIREVTFSMLTDFAALQLADLACAALYDEVHLTPKPGLVDENNNGSHNDMDISMFERSANCLKPFFEKAVKIGSTDENCFFRLNLLGREAETAMLEVTGGVNTHKGAIYSFLLLLGAIGASLHRGGDIFELAANLAKSDTRPRATDSHGSDVFIKYGLTGARGEAERGFINARKAYNIIKDYTPHKALLTLMANVPDTNVLYRGGIEALTFIQSESLKILSENPVNYLDKLTQFDSDCINRNISPGGCADMLAVALFLNKIEVLFDDSAF